VALVFLVADRLQHFGIAPGAADILGRTSATRFDQPRAKDAELGICEALDFDRVLPTVAEVVEIAERLGACVFENVEQLRLAGVKRSIGPVGIGQAPSCAASADFLEMTVGPAERGLQDEMQAIELYAERNLDPTQDFRLHIVEGDFETGDGGHAANL
jgi:hypothetical protein